MSFKAAWFWTLLVIFASHYVHAQSIISQLPQCAQTCAQTAATAAGCTDGSLTAACLCRTQSFSSAVQQCSASVCPLPDQGTLGGDLIALCASSNSTSSSAAPVSGSPGTSTDSSSISSSVVVTTVTQSATTFATTSGSTTSAITSSPAITVVSLTIPSFTSATPTSTTIVVISERPVASPTSGASTSKGEREVTVVGSLLVGLMGLWAL